MKKTLTTIALATVMTFGSTIANAGILVTDRSESSTVCSDSRPVKNGIIVFGAKVITAALTGILVTDFTGILVTDAKQSSAECNGRARNGILVTDSKESIGGILVTD